MPALLRVLVYLALTVALGQSWSFGAPYAPCVARRREMCLLQESSTGLDFAADQNENAGVTQRLSGGGGGGTDDEGNLLERAAKLRQEATEMEATLRKKRRVTAPPQPELYSLPVYKDVKDSIWTFSYRFSDQPEPKEADPYVKRTFYTGRLCLKFRADGYTDIISHVPSSNNALDIVKAWGWDLEPSNDDRKEYLLFSVDVVVPGNDESRRFYFQTRQELERTCILLKDGTVTIKQDAADATSIPGRWGFFSPKGILAQFRYVGDFAVTKTLNSLLT